MCNVYEKNMIRLSKQAHVDTNLRKEWKGKVLLLYVPDRTKANTDNGAFHVTLRGGKFYKYDLISGTSTEEITKTEPCLVFATRTTYKGFGGYYKFLLPMIKPEEINISELERNCATDPIVVCTQNEIGRAHV